MPVQEHAVARKKKNKLVISCSAFVILIILAMLALILKKNTDSRCYISEVLDGDTLLLRTGERVRLIGIDTPETVHPELPVQRFGAEAKEYMRSIAEGKYCRLESEPVSAPDAGKSYVTRKKNKDYYGRTLAYVHVGSVMLNKEMLQKGYAFAYTKYPFSRMKEFLLIERKARSSQKGLWNYTLSDGRIAVIIKMYGSLSLAGRKKFSRSLNAIHKKYSEDPDCCAQ